MSRKGLLIAVEGIDGAGKSTQVLVLKEHLEGRGYPVLLTKEPTEGPWGRKIRALAIRGRDQVSAEEELEYFIRDREDHVRDVILPALEQGRVVILDRYYFSTIAYQGASGLDPGAIREQNEAFAPKPDLLIILDVPPSMGRSRIRHGRNETPDAYEEEAFLARVREIFQSITGPGTVHVDATQSEKTVRKAIQQAVDRLLAQTLIADG